MFFKPTKKFVIIIITALCLAGITVWMMPHKSTPQTADEAQEEANMVKESLAKHMIFPDGDEPAIRKVTNKVEDPFFSKAEIGDYLVIFYKSRVAYIYSTEKNIIVNAGVVFTNIPWHQA